MSKTINVKEIAEYVAANHNISKAAAEAIVRDTFSFIKDELNSQSEINVAGFGKFVTEVKPARKGRNPKTGETIQIEEKRVVKFKPLKALRDEVNQ